MAGLTLTTEIGMREKLLRKLPKGDLHTWTKDKLGKETMPCLISSPNGKAKDGNW
jgi:hypothetical protein